MFGFTGQVNRGAIGWDFAYMIGLAAFLLAIDIVTNVGVQTLHPLFDRLTFDNRGKSTMPQRILHCNSAKTYPSKFIGIRTSD